MRFSKRWLKYSLLVLFITPVLAGSTHALPAAQAVPDAITLSLALPDYTRDAGRDMLSQFEAEHPGVTVRLVSVKGLASSPGFDPLDTRLRTVEEYVSSADVLYVDSSSFPAEFTLAGYFLDLAPLVSADPTLNAEDFFPALWESFQWDQGVWALPVSADIVILAYDPAAFDRIGLAYPNDQWTLDDLANAARLLALRDADGQVIMPGLDTFGNPVMLFRSLIGEGVFDSSVLPNSPRFSNPGLETLITTWLQLQDEGVADPYLVMEYDPELVPMQIGPSVGLLVHTYEGAPPRAGALLPGGKAGLLVDGFAISSGTRYPEQAYELVKFLTHSPEVANSFLGVTSARRSLVGIETTDDDLYALPRDFPPEAQAVIDRAVANALPVSELRYADYLSVALFDLMAADLGTTANTILQDTEALALADFQGAIAQGAATAIEVAAPPPAPELAAGEIALTFGLAAYTPTLSNQQLWDQVIQDFVAADPQVGQVALEIVPYAGIDMEAEYLDCFYAPYNLVPGLDLSTVLDLGPLIDADASFDKSDVIYGVFYQLQRENKTWALPIVIQPQVLVYDSVLFEYVGLPLPENGWTTDAFEDALRALKISPEDPAPFASRDGGSAHLSMLMAVYGGVPIDYRTLPPTINLTDPATAAAIRQVLDLAKAGYINYQKLTDLSGMFSVQGLGSVSTVFPMSLNSFSAEGILNVADSPYRLTTYPRGSQFGAVSYDIGAGYVSANAQNPEACYRWLSTLAHRPELFSAMPALRSRINDPAVVAEQGEALVAVYNQLDTLLQDVNTIVIPTQTSGDFSLVGFVLQYWLNTAFDRYVLEDSDLDAELAQAESNMLNFMDCVASIPPTDPSQVTGDVDPYMEQVIGCALSLDPSLAEFLAE